MTLVWVLAAGALYLTSCLWVFWWLDYGLPIPSRLRTALAIYVTPTVAIVAAGLELRARVREE